MESQNPTDALLITCALPAEAATIVRELELRKEERPGFLEFWKHPAEPLYLAVSGIGKLEMAAATAAALSGLDSPLFRTRALNVGMAAADTATSPPGCPYQVLKVTDASTGREYFPDLLPDLALPGAFLRTLDKPLRYLPQLPSAPAPPVLFDMEASGFWQGCRRFLPSDAIHALKVVSDSGFRPEEAPRTYNAMKSAWEDGIPEILRCIRLLRHLPHPSRLEISDDVLKSSNALVRHFRLTATQGAALRRHVNYALASGRDPLPCMHAFLQKPPPGQARLRNAAFETLLHELLES